MDHSRRKRSDRRHSQADGAARRRSWASRAIALTALSALSILGAVAITGLEHKEPVPTGYVESRFRVQMARGGTQLHEVECSRDEGTLRVFTCFAEGPYMLHYVFDVTVDAGDDRTIYIRRR
jgi:hypothetical protein